MASKRQIEANRSNAVRSTGPKTAAGKATSSRNAMRHGLARACEDADTETERIARSIGGLFCDWLGQDDALLVARAKVDLWRVRSVRYQMLAVLMTAPLNSSAKQLINLERYERLARAKQRRLLRSLSGPEVS